MEKLNKRNKTPLRYPGGKSKAIYKLEKFLPVTIDSIHEINDCFLGGGSFMIYLTKLYPDKVFKVNDIYYPLYNFWVQLRDHGERLSDVIHQIKLDNPNHELARVLYEEQKKVLQDKDDDKEKDEETKSFDKAVAFYITNKCSFSGLSSSSFSKQASDSNFSINSIVSLKYYSQLIKNWKIYNMDYREFIKQNSNREDVFLYLDPPYMIKDNLYGDNGKLHEIFKHETFFEVCKPLLCKQLISYNSDNLIKDAFKDYIISDYDLTYTMRSTGSYMEDQKKRKELAITNYKERVVN